MHDDRRILFGVRKGEPIIPWVMDSVSMYNTGHSLGLKLMSPALAAAIKAVLLMVVVLWTARLIREHPTWPISLVVGSATVFAGGLGNLFDHMFYPGVRDFIVLFPLGKSFLGQNAMLPYAFNLAMTLVSRWTYISLSAGASSLIVEGAEV